MKVIELLNKIANGEEVPKKIRYQADSHKKDLYTYNEYTGDYEREIGLNLFVYLFMKERITGFLNNEVEVEVIEEKEMCHKCGKYPSEYNQTYCEFCLGISEEDKKIEKLDHEDFTDNFGGELITDMKLVNKINEIIDKINGGE